MTRTFDVKNTWLTMKPQGLCQRENHLQRPVKIITNGNKSLWFEFLNDFFLKPGNLSLFIVRSHENVSSTGKTEWHRMKGFVQMVISILSSISDVC